MKMTREHFVTLQARITDVLRDNPDAWTNYRAAGLTANRFRWDVYWRATQGQHEFRATVSNYLNDANIETALRKAIPLT